LVTAIGLALLVVALGCLSTMLAVRRGWLVPGRLTIKPPGWLETALCSVLLLAVNGRLVKAFLFGPFVPAGDLQSHALVAREIALGHTTGGWFDGALASFPIGPHYPIVGWVLGAALTWLGMPAPVAAVRVGVAALLAFNLLVYTLSRRAGATLGAALAGAVVVSIVSPITGFMGGVQALLALGLLSQVVAMPAVALHAYNVLFGRSTRGVAFSAALVVLTHPQVAAALAVLLACAALVQRGASLRRCGFALMMQGVIGAAVFGPGLLSLKVPFGWPSMVRWCVVGRPPAMFWGWLVDGEIFDFGRDPVLTGAVAGSLLVLVVSSARREARHVLLVAAVVLGLCVIGTPLDRAGRFGALLLSFLQPLRAYALLPPVAAVMVIVAINIAEVAWRSKRWLGAAVPLVALAWLASAAPADTWSSRRQVLGLSTTPDCRAVNSPEMHRLLTTAGDGRLYYDEHETPCHDLAPYYFWSSGPVGSAVVGAHVGLVWDAMLAFNPEKPGAGDRGDLLGINTIVHKSTAPPQPPEAFRERGRIGQLVVSERVPPTSYFSLGCVSQVWSGSDAVLREAVHQAFASHRAEVRWPQELIALEESTATVVDKRPSPTACDRARASLLASKRVTGGQYTAMVQASAPVDLVLKETAHRLWRIQVDGGDVPYRLVAPGFMAIHLEPGLHHVEARIRWDVRYWLGVAAGLLLAAVLAERVRRSGWLQLAA
jgi:hypothetical protein